ncbi:capsule assembly Wzi family protein [Granulicella rosea]|uniref:capsule assembly Wzi family protein n=1 Tax=Granulicella rosea TaxID=474952 RepID=UPI001FE27737|nr:capsule assembly Wzi family protein [Granulicella rosea]
MNNFSTPESLHLTSSDTEPAARAVETSEAFRAASWHEGLFKKRQGFKFAGNRSSVYLPDDSWIYPEMTRLYSMGYVDSMYLSMRPWTRLSLLHMLQETQDNIMSGSNEEAKEILAVVLRELTDEETVNAHSGGTIYGVDSMYTRMMGIAGPSLRDSYNLGQTIVNDYGRPYQPGFNTIDGVSTTEEKGRFSLYIRGEYQHSPSGTGYSPELANTLSILDIGLPYIAPNAPQATIPAGPIAAQNPFRLVEAVLSFHFLNHEISGGKTDSWLGPGQGGSLAWSNNAENIYSFRIDRVEPLYIPLLSRVLGPVRYNFMYGSLKGHTAPNSPYVHEEAFSFRPTKNFEFAFERTVIFGGEGHTPVTLHTFLRSFFSLSDVEDDPGVKLIGQDPGARFSDFSFSWRLPFISKYVTLYADSECHDDVTPISAPRRAAYRPGFVISQIPGARKMELRVEGLDSNQPTTRSNLGHFTYFEGFQPQGYTNKGFIMGDWLGRQAVGEQSWLTYHLSGNELVQLEYVHKKNAHDFTEGGTTQNQFKLSVVKRFKKDLELNAWVQQERFKAPLYLPGARNNTTAVVQLTYFPKLRLAGLGKD